jgi:hypothetical protein
MSVLEPVAQPTALEAVVPEQRMPVEPVSAPVHPVVDHTRTHAVTCYWDVAECRWQCTSS